MDLDQIMKKLANSNPVLKQRLIDCKNFSSEVERIKQQYSLSRVPEDLAGGIRLLSQNADYLPFAHLLIFLGDSYMENGDFEAGMACMNAVVAHFPDIYHYAIIYLRMAQYYIEKGDTETGIDFLGKLCTEVRDYKIHIVLNGLAEVWEKYKYLIASKMPELNIDEPLEPIIPASSPQPLTPDKCSQTIAEILSQPQESLLADLSAHLGELTANGTVLSCLNKWERVFYYADELCTEVNSGGFEGYLYYHGTHFEKACQSFVQIGADQMISLTQQIRNKFPQGRIPKSQDSIQNALDRLEDKGVDFDGEDDIYYSSAEKELLERLSAYVLKNQNHFR